MWPDQQSGIAEEGVTAMGVTRQMAEFVEQVVFDRLPPEVVQAGKRCLLDYLGVALGACSQESIQILASTAEELGGRPQASILGSGARTSVLHAAMVNGAMSHVLDYDDSHIETSIHPTGPVMSAALALAEWRRLAGKQLLAAHAAGVELELRLGRAVRPAHYEAGWHMSGTMGTFGAAMAAGHLLRLEVDELCHALGMAGSQASGIREMFGSMTKCLHVGKAASNGLLAALLAARGFTASTEVLEGRRGFCAVLAAGQCDFSRATSGLGSDYLLLSNGFKLYPCGVVTHPIIDGVRRLRERYGLRAEDVAEMELQVCPVVLDVTGKRAPGTGLEGKFSVYFCAAIALIDGSARQSQFSDEKVKRPDVVALMERVRAVARPEIPKSQAIVTIRTSDGRQLVEKVEAATGMPGNPVPDDELVGKFLDMAVPVVGRSKAERLVDEIWHLERVEDVSGLVALARNED